MTLDVKATLINPGRAGKLVDAAAVKNAINAALDDAARAVKVELLGPTNTWNSPPDFAISTPGVGVRLVETDDDKYHWLDEGTEPHEIRPKKAGGRLRFTVPFSPKTSAAFTSGPGGRGSSVVYARAVKHPGIKPRSWVERIQEIWEDRELPKRLDRALADALK